MVTFYKRLSKAVDNLTNAVNVESDHDAAENVAHLYVFQQESKGNRVFSKRGRKIY